MIRTKGHTAAAAAAIGTVACVMGGAQAPEARQAHVRALTHTVNAYGCFSPDGSTIVFQSNATGRWQLYTTRADGHGRSPLIRSESDDITPVYSPEGARILFVSERDGNREVYVCNADGTEQRNLTNHPSMDLHPMWSADGARVIFSSNRGKPDRNDYDIYTMRIDGSELTQITSGPEIDTYASWSPDGTRIVTRRVIDGGRNNEVFVMDADGSNPVNLTNAPDHYDGWPVWSPDGKRICFAGGGPDNGNKYLFLINPDGTGKVQLTSPWMAGSGHCYDTQPSFSRDGARIVFTRYRPSMMFESTELMILTVPREG
jgi:TolB protein